MLAFSQRGSVGDMMETGPVGPVGSLNWYVLTVHAGKEEAACRILERGRWVTGERLVRPWRVGAVMEMGEVLRFETFLPLKTIHVRERRGAQKRVPVTRPLVNRYLFMGFAGPVPWLRLMELNVVTGVVGIDGEPAVVPAAAVDRMKRLYAGGRAVVEPVTTLKAGDRCQIDAGPAHGTFVVIERITGASARFLCEATGWHGEAALDNLRLVA